MADPRWLNKVALAAHLSIPDASISRLVRNGRIPPPSYHLGPRSARWDREAVDTAFSGVPKRISVEAAMNAYIQNELRRGPSPRMAKKLAAEKADRSKG